jgi:nicotinamide-nucleotide amidase
MFAEILAIGSEMLTPHRVDTNSLWLTSELNALGVSVAFKTIVGDNHSHLTAAIRTALGRADILILSGGLGPTEDDLTRECVAEALGVEVHPDPATIAMLYKRFAERRIAMTPNNAKQADVVEGAQLLNNRTGSAPGQWIDVNVEEHDARHRKLIMMLPGVPSELKQIFSAECIPRLAAAIPERHIARQVLRMALMPESQVDARTAPIYSQFADVETTILAGGGEIQLHFTSAKPTLAEAEARVTTIVKAIEEEMGEDIFSSQGESLEEVVLLLLGLHNQTLAVAESCTGGLFSQRLTAVPNASRVFLGGAVVYSDALKTRFAGVPAETLNTHGAISEPTARALAEGIREATGATLGVSITGIAGPTLIASGADAGKPLGLVFIGVSDGTDTQVRQLHLSGDRERIRLFAAMHALEMVRRHLQ